MAAPRSALRAWTTRLAGSDAGWLAGTTALATALCVPVYRLWETSLSIPWRYGGDASFYGMLAKGLDDNGWAQRNAFLGAPEGQRLYDFPIGADNLHLAVLKVLSFLTPGYAIAVNVFFLLTFATVAATAFFALRKMGSHRAIAVAGSLAFTFLPYHVLRSEGHLFLISYAVVPLVCLLVWRLAAGLPTVGDRRRIVRIGRLAVPAATVGTVAIAIAAGSSGVYYAVFSLLLLLFGGVIGAVRQRRRRVLAVALAVAAVVAVTLTANLGSSIAQRGDRGRNPVVSARSPTETEWYSFNLARLLTPLPYHRIDAFAGYGARYASGAAIPSAGEGTGYIGAVLGIGFLGALAALALQAVRPRPWPATQARLATLGVLALGCFVFGTTGGISSFLAFSVTPELHGGGRILVFLAFFSAAAVAIGTTALAFRAGTPGRRSRGLATVAAVGIAAVALFDQTPHFFTSDWYRAQNANWASDAAFVTQIESTIPAGSLVYQLPYVAFPHDGSTVGQLVEYDPLRLYLHSDTTRWSYGSMNGRPENWAAQLAALPLGAQLAAIRACGFRGVTVDRLGYGEAAATIEATLAAGSRPTLVSPDQRFAFVDLGAAPQPATPGRPCVASDAQVPIAFGEGFYAAETDGVRTWRWAEARASLRLSNDTGQDRRVSLTAELVSSAQTRHPLSVTLPGGATLDLEVSSQPHPVELAFVLPPGESDIVLETNAPEEGAALQDSRDLRVALFDVVVVIVD